MRTTPPDIQTRWTYRDLDRLPADLVRYKLREGELIMTPAPNVAQQTLVMRIVRLFVLHDPQQALGSTLYSAYGRGAGGGRPGAALPGGRAAELPPGTEIYFGNRQSATGGRLDLDSNFPCGSNTNFAENVFWPTGQAPRGTYRVFVNQFSTCGAGDARWTLVVRVDGQVVLQDRAWAGRRSSSSRAEGAAAPTNPNALR